MLVLEPTSLLLPVVIVVAGSVIVVLLLSNDVKVTASDGTSITPRKIHSLGTKIPLIGDALEAFKHEEDRHDWFAAQSRRFQYHPWRLCVPGIPPTVVISSPASVDAVLATQFDKFIKGKTQIDFLHDLLGDGLLSSDGERWYHQRKIAAKFFSAKTLRLMMMQTMQKNVTLMYSVLDAHCDYADSKLADLTLLFHQFTLQTFVEVAVGTDFPVIGENAPHPFEAAADAAIPVIARRTFLPPIVWKLERWLNVGPERVLAESMCVVKDWVHEMVTASLSGGANHVQGTRDDAVRSAIDLFVEHSQEDKAGVRPQDLVDFMVTFVLAARDTSALTTSWFFYALSKHRHVEQKIRAEFAAKLPLLGVTNDTYLTADHVKHLVYLEATIKETLRLYPAGPLTTREATEDTVIDGDILIRKGEWVALSIYAMARNTLTWGPDAAEFNPDRWIDAVTGELIQVHPSKFVSFSAGPRMCIGMKLAMLSLRVVTANLLHRYHFEIDPRNDGSYVNAPALAMKHALLATVRRV